MSSGPDRARALAEEALRATEARLRHLVEHAQDLIYDCDTLGRFTYVNPSAARVMQYDPQELIGRHFLQLIRPEHHTEAGALYARQLFDQIPNTYLEFRALTKGGDTIWIGQHVQLVKDGGRVVGMQAIARDITRQKEAEERLRQAQKMEAVGILARGVAHDFNNVLAAILGCSNLLLTQLDADDPAREEAEEIAKAAQRGAALTRQLLAFSRRQAIDAEPIDLAGVVLGSEGILRRLVGNAAVLSLRVSGRALNVRAEASHIEQVLMNLVVNARDAMPADGETGEIDVLVDAVDLNDRMLLEPSGLRPGVYARMSVRDTGEGIAADIQRHVFEPFFTTKDPDKGTGLGLSIVYGIAKDAGGTVSFSSIAGAGTVFEVLLPIAS